MVANGWPHGAVADSALRLSVRQDETIDAGICTTKTLLTPAMRYSGVLVAVFYLLSFLFILLRALLSLILNPIDSAFISALRDSSYMSLE